MERRTTSDRSPEDASARPSSPSEGQGAPSWRTWGRLLRFRFHQMSTVHLVASCVVAVVFAGSLWVIARKLQGFAYAEVWAYLTALPPSYVLTGLCLTALTFVVLAGYDALALRYINERLSTPRIAFSAFVGYAVSQAIGNPLLTGGSVRYRLYSLWGLAPRDVAKSILFAGTSFWLGFFTLGGMVFLFVPVGLAEATSLPVPTRLLGVGCLLPVAAYVTLTLVRDRPLEAWGWTLAVPARWMLPVQVGLAAADLLLASSVVYVLLPPEAGVGLPQVVGVYLIALLAGLVSHVPGGLGVFESVMLLLLAPPLSAPTLLGALLAYRGIFHLLPLTLAVLAFGAYELRRGMGPR